MKDEKKEQGYKYVVYIRPGYIEYFFDYIPAKECADFYDVEVQEL